eukprot:CFRG7811T1
MKKRDKRKNPKSKQKSDESTMFLISQNTTYQPSPVSPDFPRSPTFCNLVEELQRLSAPSSEPQQVQNIFPSEGLLAQPAPISPYCQYSTRKLSPQILNPSRTYDTVDLPSPLSSTNVYGSPYNVAPMLPIPLQLTRPTSEMKNQRTEGGQHPSTARLISSAPTHRHVGRNKDVMDTFGMVPIANQPIEETYNTAGHLPGYDNEFFNMMPYQSSDEKNMDISVEQTGIPRTPVENPFITNEVLTKHSSMLSPNPLCSNPYQTASDRMFDSSVFPMGIRRFSTDESRRSHVRLSIDSAMYQRPYSADQSFDENSPSFRYLGRRESGNESAHNTLIPKSSVQGTPGKKLRRRRTHAELSRTFTCTYENCERRYASAHALHMHIRMKHTYTHPSLIKAKKAKENKLHDTVHGEVNYLSDRDYRTQAADSASLIESDRLNLEEKSVSGNGRNLTSLLHLFSAINTTKEKKKDNGKTKAWDSVKRDRQ